VAATLLAAAAPVVIGRKNNPPLREHIAFNSQERAVDLAMSLDHPNGERYSFICRMAILPSCQ
jgi:hypothetical protein